jgi:hypothetical protein
MKKTLRSLIEEDIEKILDNIEIKKKNFLFLIIHYLLECKSVNLKEVNNLSIELNNKYEQFLEVFEKELVSSNGEIIEVLRNSLKNFWTHIEPILNKIKELK